MINPHACFTCDQPKQLHDDETHMFYSWAKAQQYFEREDQRHGADAAAVNGASLDAEAGLPLGSRLEGAEA